MAKQVGIDLGTTNSVVAIRMDRAAVLQNRENQDLTPSVVGLHKGDVIVGSIAVDKMRAAPTNTIISVKRLMGRAFKDDEVKKMRATTDRYQYEIVEPSDGTDDDVRVVLGGKQHSPVEISAHILRKLKDDAALRLGGEVDAAVITVPAYFTDKQRHATRKAGQLAGLRVLKVIDEPTAAAYAFGVDSGNPDEAKTILVYDLGGGTFDVSVLTAVGGIFAQLAIEGDMWLGGDDFDFKIVDHVVEHLQASTGVDSRTDKSFMVELKRRAQQAKETLSTLTKTDIVISGVLRDADRNYIDVDLEITRAQFERMITDDVRRSVDKVRDALNAAGLAADQIDHVLLVGGSSTIPLVRKLLADVFPQSKILMNVDPMKCVAYGAATLAAKLTTVECSRGHRNSIGGATCDQCGEPLVITPADASPDIFALTGMPYGIETSDGEFSVIIPKGSPYPTPEPIVKRFLTPRANLRRLRVAVFAGFAEVAAKNELQATLWLELPGNVPALTPVDIAFSLDPDGILQKVKVALKDGSGTEVETFLDRGDMKRSRLEKKLEHLRRQKEEMAADLDPSVQQALEDAYSRATQVLTRNQPEVAETELGQMEEVLNQVRGAAGPEWKRKAEGLISWTEFVLSEHGWLLEPPTTLQLKTLVEALRQGVMKNDQVATEQKFAELDKATDELPDAVRVMMFLVRAAQRATEQGDELRADKVRIARREFEAACRRKDFDGAHRILDGVLPVVKDIMGGGDMGSDKSRAPVEDRPQQA